MLYGFDSETRLIQPGLQAPPPVCFQYCTGNVPQLIHAHLDPNARRFLAYLLDPASDVQLTGHNIAFDMVVICAWATELIPAVFAAYERGAVHCTLIREVVLDIADGNRRDMYDLESVSKRYPGCPRADKSDTWRLRYAELETVPLDQWPKEALEYAGNDGFVALQLHHEQDRRASMFGPGVLDDAPRQAAASFWLQLTSAWGVHTDPVAVDNYHRSESARLASYRDELLAAKLIRANGTRDTKVAKALMEIACREADMEVPRTKGGDVSMSDDSIKQTGNPLLRKYSDHGTSSVLMSRIERLRIGATYPIQPRFTTLVDTGRTSCSQGDPRPGATGLPSAYGYQLQNPNRKPGVRECFVPRPGSWFLSCDYSGMELRTWAFACLKLVGQSRMAEVLNSGNDPHTDLGATLAGVSYQQALGILHGSEGPERKEWFKSDIRQVSKIGNFGYPGGMGAKRFVAQARSEYDVDITLERAIEVRNGWRATWPESLEYFAFINRLLDGGDICTLRHLVSGRYRGAVGYCQACNSFFQGLAADIAKYAGFQVSRACYAQPSSPLYGCRIWNFAHDELLLEVPADPYRATLAGWECARLMVTSAQEWIPELAPAIQVEPALMLRWSKKADMKIATQGPYKGCLIPWEWDATTGGPINDVR